MNTTHSSPEHLHQ